MGFDVVLGGFGGVVRGVSVMPLGDMGVVGGRLMISFFVMTGSFAMMLSRLVVMIGSLAVMMSRFL